MSRHVLVIAALSLTACSLVPGSKDPSSSDGPSTTSATAASTAKSSPPKVSDKDEGSVSALQTKHEGQIVFSNAPIEKTEADEAKLVTASTLDKPLFVRAYFPKTPVAVLRDNGQTYCSDESQVKYAFQATLEGAEGNDATGVMAHKDAIKKDLALSIRTFGIEDSSGAPLSITPQGRIDVSTGFNATDNPSAFRFLALASLMKPGKNLVTLSLRFGCDGHPGTNKKEMNEVATGQITIDVKPGELAAFSKKTVAFAPGADPSTEAKLKPAYVKSLAAGKTLVRFAADKPIVKSVFNRATSTRAIVRTANGQCMWYADSYEDPNKTNLFNDGRFVGVAHAAMPCPE